MFSRKTIIDIVTKYFDGLEYHDQVDRVLLLFGLEDIAPRDGSVIMTRSLKVCTHLIRNPDAITETGENLQYSFLSHIIPSLRRTSGGGACGDMPAISNYPDKIVNTLKYDGYVIEDDHIISMLPDIVEDIAEQENELYILLNKYSLSTPITHLNQARDNHARSNWPSANSQIRSFIEGLFDFIADSLSSNATSQSDRNNKWTWLVKTCSPPFILENINEWEDRGKGFLQGFWKRLCPDGSHPGISDEEDCTFRLQLSILTAYYILRRYDKRVS